MKIQEHISEILLFLKDYDDIDILNDGSDGNGIIMIDYGWGDHEERDFNEATLNLNNYEITLNLNNYVLKIVKCCYSCEGGDYEQETTMPFVDFNDLFANLKKGIREFYDL